MTQTGWWQLLLALGYGIFGSVVPVVNGEAFIVAALATKLIGPVEVGLVLGLGQGIGKMILFQLVRQGRRLPLLQRGGGRRDPEPGSWRARWAKAVAWGTRLVEDPKWGPLGCFLSGSVSLPPNYATTVLAATTRVNFAVFSVFLTLGYLLRYVVIALAVSGLLGRIW